MINYNSFSTITDINSSGLKTGSTGVIGSMRQHTTALLASSAPGLTLKKGSPINKLFLVFFLMAAAPVFAENENNQIGIPPYLYRYESNYVGFTHDNDATDNAFLDFNISVMAPLLPKWFNLNTQYGNVFLAVTIRAGQYYERNSSPVIGKTFSPKLFYRHWNDSNKDEDSSYIDIGYAHLSNGQLIHTLDQFKQQVASDQDPSRALDHISRGWDYAEFLIKRHYNLTTANIKGTSASNIFWIMDYYNRNQRTIIRGRMLII